jgi:hypothetical protein
MDGVFLSFFEVFHVLKISEKLERVVLRFGTSSLECDSGVMASH